MRKTFLYRLYPTKEQQRLLTRQLEECRWLWNHLLAERKEAWEQRQESLKLYDQQATLPALKAERPQLAGVHSQVSQNVAVRLDLAFKVFFRRVAAGEEQPGYPRFRGVGRYDSLTFPQVPVGCRLVEAENGEGREGRKRHIHIHGVGQVKVVWHRPLGGTPKTATIRRHRTGKWYVAFSCECAEPTPLPPTGQQVGLDMGLAVFAMPSEGDPMPNPRFFRAEEHALAKAQRRHSQVEKGTPERAARRQVVARVYERTRWRREDFAHQHSRKVVNAYDLIAVERLDIKEMVTRRTGHEGSEHRNGNGNGARASGGGSGGHKRPRLAKSIHDAAWGQFAQLLAYKAAWAGRQYVAVDPAYTSQDCSRCGHRQKLALSHRTYSCPSCGLVLDRDRNAARNILRLGQQSLAAA